MNNDNFRMPSPVITGFCTASNETLEKLKNEFELFMSTETLLVIKDHFGRVEARDITLDELYFLDSLLKLRKTDVRTEHIRSVTSYDARVGESFDDLQKKLNAISPETRAPYSYGALLGTSQRVLDAISKPQSRIQIFTDHSPLLRAAASSCADISVVEHCNGECVCAVKNTSVSADLKKQSDTDCFLLVYREDGEYSSKFEAAISAMLISLQGTTVIKSAYLTDESGVINAILQSSSGAYINYFDAAPSGAMFDPKQLDLGLPADSALLMVSGYSVSTILSNAARFGLKALVFGRPMSVKRFTLKTGMGAPVSFSSDFVRNLCTVSLKDACVEHKKASFAPALEPIHASGMRTYSSDPYAVTSDGILLSSVHCGSLCFEGAVLSMLEAVSRLVSCGVPYKDAISAVRINSPVDNESDILSAISGIYRVRAELLLSSSEDSVCTSENASVHCFAAANKRNREIPHVFSDSDKSSVYLIAPRVSSDGLPDFRDVRLIFDYIFSLISDNAVLSVRAIGTSGLEKTLSEMGERASFTLPKNTPSAPAGSFIVETAQKINGFLLIS